jgi:hypothetical protein
VRVRAVVGQHAIAALLQPQLARDNADRAHEADDLRRLGPLGKSSKER